MPETDPPGGARWTARSHDYRAYGLLFRSDLELPFVSAIATGRPDVRLRLGRVPDALPSPRTRFGLWEAAPDDFLLRVPDVGRYRVTGGTEIVVEPVNGVNCGAVVAYLVGSVLGACLQQRGIVTLHASAVATPDGAVLFAGRSGAGKSTLLAALTERGYAMLADDVTGIVLGCNGRPAALSGHPTARLWGPAMDRLGWERTRALGRVTENSDKYLVPIERFRDAAAPLRGVFVLRTHNRESIEIEPMMAPGAAFVLLAAHTYRRRFLAGLDGLAGHFCVTAETANHAWLATVTRPMAPFLLETLADRIEEHLDAMPSPSRAERAESG